MDKKTPHQLSPAQRQLIAALGLRQWQYRHQDASSEAISLCYFRIGTWLIAAPQLPIPAPNWLQDLFQSIAQGQSTDTSATPIEVSASVAQTWSSEHVFELGPTLPNPPTAEAKQLWWKQLCQTQ